jgi:hypothetical protein
MSKHFDYFNNSTRDRPRAFIQYKGTDICCDIHCPNCKAHGHIDSYFCYQYRCLICNKVYELSPFIEMKEIENPDKQEMENAKVDLELLEEDEGQINESFS